MYTMVKLMDNTVIHEVYSSVKQAFFTVLLFGIKIWQVLVFLIIPYLFVAIQCKNRKHVSCCYISIIIHS